MSPRTKKILIVIMIGACYLILDYLRVEYRHISFSEAREMADNRFQVNAEIYHLLPSDFGPPMIDDRQDEWLFKWRVLQGEGGITVIVRRNGEVFDGGDERLDPNSGKM